MGIDQDFEKAAEDVKNLSKRPSDDELLELYALFKQATVGDVNSGEYINITRYLNYALAHARPGVFDLKGKAKWDRWSSKKGISQEDAKKSYISYAAELLTTYK